MLDLETLYHYVCEKQEEPIFSIPSHFCLPFAILKSEGLMKPFKDASMAIPLLKDSDQHCIYLCKLAP